MKITPHYPTLAVCCRDCQQAGDPHPPVLARFEQFPDGKVEPAPTQASGAIRRAARGEARLAHPPEARPWRGERGDVPGWGLITAMTVALVMLVWGVASEALRDIIAGFLDQVRFD